MEMRDFFGHIETFRFRGLFDDVKEPWDAVGKIPGFISLELHELQSKDETKIDEMIDGAGVLSLADPHSGQEEWLLSSHGFILVEADTLLKHARIFLGAGTVIEPGVVIKSGALIGRESALRQGAYLRGGVIVGDHSVVGHTTEMKNSVFMDHVEAGHFAYVGDSILGAYANLGAGCKLANLPFRSLKEKEEGTFPPMTVKTDEGERNIELSKLGAILGDGVETGCNSVTSPGTFVGKDSWIYPCAYVRKGYYPPRSIIKGGNELYPKR